MKMTMKKKGREDEDDDDEERKKSNVLLQVTLAQFPHGDDLLPIITPMDQTNLFLLNNTGSHALAST